MTDQPATENLSPRLVDLLEGGDGLLDLVLRGHLHIEQMLLSMIEHWAASPHYVAEARLSFSQKLALVRALNLHHPNEPIWDALSALNTLRNDLAHRLTSNQRERKVAAFIACTDRDSPPTSVTSNDAAISTTERLLGCFAYLVGSLEAMGNEYSVRASLAKSAGKFTQPRTSDRGSEA